MGGYAGQIKGWRWPIYELLWLSSIAFVALVLLLPETLGQNILHKRAARLRKLTGNPLLRSQSEIDEEGKSVRQTLVRNIKRTFEVAFQPTVMFANVYLGFAYGVSRQLGELDEAHTGATSSDDDDKPFEHSSDSLTRALCAVLLLLVRGRPPRIWKHLRLQPRSPRTRLRRLRCRSPDRLRLCVVQSCCYAIR